MTAKNHPFRLCYVIPADFIGGAELFALDFIKQIADQAEIFVIHSPEPTFEKALKKLPVQTRTMPFPRIKKFSLKSLFDYFLTARRLKKVIAEIKPSVVLTNSIRAHIVAARALGDSQTPLAFFVHDFTFPTLFFRLTQGKAQRIFTCSEEVKHDLITKGGEPAKIEVIYNGVDLERFTEPSKSTKIRIGIIGRIDPWKGQDVFIQAANKIADPHAEFLIYGESSPYDKKTVAFEKRLKKNAGRVIFKGFVPAEKALKNLDILVHASKNPEPFGRVIVEAMAAGVAVIASPLGGAREIIHDGRNGLAVAPNNPELLTEAILKLAHNLPLREKLIAQAHKDVQARFSLAKISAKLLAGLKKLSQGDKTMAKSNQ